MTSTVIGARLRTHRRTMLVRVARYFINLDMPNPETNWRQMLASIGFVVLVGVAFVLLFFALQISIVPL
ncbi:MAG: hypothetical protein M0P74_00640 [Syntrophales bacterium]|jgi:hypothetical protein|nr:hypothetical protein [Syntrophales bacterium]